MSNEMQPVLIVSYFFPPVNSAGVFRILGFTKDLPNSGIRPVILTASTATGREHCDYELNAKIPGNLVVDRIGAWCMQIPIGNSFWGKAWREGVKQIDRFMPLDPYFLFGLMGAVRARRLIREQGLRAIVTSSPPHSIHLLGYIQKRYFKTPWIADFRDPVRPRAFPRMEGEGWDNYSLSEKLERLVVENADAIIANTPTNQAILAARYPKYREHVLCIPNGFDVDDSKNKSTQENKAGRQGKKLLVAYTGEIYEGMGDALWEGLRILKRNDPSISEKLEIRIAGILTETDLRLIEKSGLSDFVKYLGFLKVVECQKLLDTSDVSLFLLPKEGYAFWVPSKLYGYLGNGKFVFAIVPEGDASKIIESVNAGICIRPSPEKIAEGFQNLVVRHSNSEMEPSYNLAALDKYKRPYQAKQLAEAIHKIIDSAR